MTTWYLYRINAWGQDVEDISYMYWWLNVAVLLAAVVEGAY